MGIARKGLLDWAGDRALTLWMGNMEKSREGNVWLVKHQS